MILVCFVRFYLIGRKAMVSVLFLCTGNICRSPTAEAVFRAIVKESNMAEKFVHDSAGTHGYHVGEAPDGRSVEIAEAAGIDMDGLYARKLQPSDFEEFDYIIAMDAGHANFARNMMPQGAKAQVCLLMDYHPDYAGRDVPDPYYGSIKDFKYTFDLIELGVQALYKNLKG